MSLSSSFETNLYLLSKAGFLSRKAEDMFLARPEDLVGKQLDDYQLLEFLEGGGFGFVYKAEEVYLDRKVAIKFLHPKHMLDKEEAVAFMADFQQEAKTVASLSHPNILGIYRYAIDNKLLDNIPIPFIVMPFIETGSLRKLHPKGTHVEIETIVSYVKQIAIALQYAHERKIVHRDVKPENILVGQHGLLVSDFGIAVTAHSLQSLSLQDRRGTLPYMAPEQFDGKAQIWSDQYSLAVVVYEWLCGKPPFSGKSWIDFYDKHKKGDIPAFKLQGVEISLPIEEVVKKALATDPQQRFASVQEFADALEQANMPTVPIPNFPSPSSVISVAPRSIPITPELEQVPSHTSIVQKLKTPRTIISLIVLVVLIVTGGTTFFSLTRPHVSPPATPVVKATSAVPLQSTLTPSPTIGLNPNNLYMTWEGIAYDPRMFWASFDGTNWSPQQAVPSVQTSSAPALAIFQHKLYIVWRDFAGATALSWTSFDGTKWSAPSIIPVGGTNSAPALAVFQNKLYMAWRGIAGDARIFWTSFDGTRWSQQQMLAVGTSNTPALAVFQGKLYMTWRGVASDARIFIASFDGTKWSGQQVVPAAETSGAPALASYQGKLYMVWRDATADPSVHWTSFDGRSWSLLQTVPAIGTNNSPALATFQSKLYMVWRGVGSDQHIFRASFDGTRWSGQQSIPPVGTNNTPALATFSIST